MAMTDPVNAAAPGQLPCGRSVEDVWNHLAEPANSHERTCPYCQDARTKLTALDAATHDLRAGDPLDPAMQPSPALRSSIMVLARTELRRSRRLPMIQPRKPETTDPPLLISEFAICDQVRATADTMPGIHARRCAADLDGTTEGSSTPDGIGDDVRGGTRTEPGTAVLADQPAKIIITLTIAVSSLTDIPSATTRLRQRIIDRLTTRTGLTITAVNITVEDFYDV